MTPTLSDPYHVVWGTAVDVHDSGRRLGSIHTHRPPCCCIEHPDRAHTVALCARVDWRQVCDDTHTALAALTTHYREAHP